MHYRRLASFVLGAWIACSVLMVIVTIQVRNVDHVVATPPPDVHKLVEAVSTEHARALLRYQAWLKARSFFYGWGIAQVPLALAVAWLLLLSTRINKVGAGTVFAMLIMACFAQFVVGPELTYVGGTLDLGSTRLGGRERYFVLHALYVAMEALKVSLGAGLAAYLFVYRSHRPFPGVEQAAVTSQPNAADPPGAETRRLGSA